MDIRDIVLSKFDKIVRRLWLTYIMLIGLFCIIGIMMISPEIGFVKASALIILCFLVLGLCYYRSYNKYGTWLLISMIISGVMDCIPLLKLFLLALFYKEFAFSLGSFFLLLLHASILLLNIKMLKINKEIKRQLLCKSKEYSEAINLMEKAASKEELDESLYQIVQKWPKLQKEMYKYYKARKTIFSFES